MNSEEKINKVVIYTDGACSGNPGNGGWGAILLCNITDENGKQTEIIKKISGGEKMTTNNKMELKAVISGLLALKIPCDVDLFTDSKYVMDGATKWLNNWQQNQWKTSSKKNVANQELWQQLIPLLKKHNITWHWVKGHDIDTLNNEVDMMARKESKKF